MRPAHCKFTHGNAVEAISSANSHIELAPGTAQHPVLNCTRYYTAFVPTLHPFLDCIRYYTSSVPELPPFLHCPRYSTGSGRGNDDALRCAPGAARPRRLRDRGQGMLPSLPRPQAGQ